MEGKGKDERVKREKIGRGRIAVGLSRAHFDFPPFLQPATQCKFFLILILLTQEPIAIAYEIFFAVLG